MLNNRFFAGILLGAAAGAAIALFVNSDKGKEVIDDLKDAASDAGDKLKSHLNDFEDEVSSLIKKGRRFVEDLESRAEESFD
jgi:gas vesicle protein